MREAKDKSNNNKEDMAAFFGIHPKDMSETSDKKEPNATTVTPIPSAADDVAKEEKKSKKQKRRKKKRKRKREHKVKARTMIKMS
eukprot:12054307-Ditylum_brightwellii.AAC.1